MSGILPEFYQYHAAAQQSFSEVKPLWRTDVGSQLCYLIRNSYETGSKRRPTEGKIERMHAYIQEARDFILTCKEAAPSCGCVNRYKRLSHLDEKKYSGSVKFIVVAKAIENGVVKAKKRPGGLTALQIVVTKEIHDHLVVLKNKAEGSSVKRLDITYMPDDSTFLTTYNTLDFFYTRLLSDENKGLLFPNLNPKSSIITPSMIGALKVAVIEQKTFTTLFWDEALLEEVKKADKQFGELISFSSQLTAAASPQPGAHVPRVTFGPVINPTTHQMDYGYTYRA